MEEIFFFNKLIAARCCLPVLFLRRGSDFLLLKEVKSKLWAAWIGAASGALALLLTAEAAFAAPFSNRKAWKWGSFLMALAARGSTLGFPLLALFALFLGTASPALGAEKFCSDPPYFGVIDGNIRPVPTQITIDCDCTFKNFPQSKPLTTTVNFHTNDPTIYLIIYDNVYFTGHMACANVDHRIWFSNSSDYGSSNACQDLFIPVETIDKKNPAGQTTAAIGVPFSYTLTLPAMSLGGGPSANDLHSVTIWDDLTATGADLTYVDINAYYKGSGNPVTLVPENDPSAPGGVWTPKNLSYEKIPLIRAGEQIVVEVTVVLDDTARNAAGTQFTNTAKWQFGRLIDGTYYEPLPGEWGHTEPMTIVEPDLVVTKTGSTSVINLAEWAEFTIDVWNSGTWAGDAWNVNIVDRLPSESSNSFNGGMCNLTPEVTGVTLAGRTLTLNTDYSLSYAGCELSLTLLEAAGPIGPNERLIISYRTKVDADSESGALLTNVAAATQWSNDEDGNIGQTYTCPLTDGTEGTSDCQDAHDLLVLLSGYFFEKTVSNPDTGELVTTAMSGETLRYTLRLQSIDESFDGLRFYDDLNTSAAFAAGSLSLVSYPAGADISRTSAGILDIRNLSISAGGAIEVKFDITLASTLPEGFVVLNQADLIHGTDKIADSDDPNINGQADSAVVGDEDPTQVVINCPQLLPPIFEVLKTSTIMEGDPDILMAGERLRYTITVKNIGSENASNVRLQDYTPANTTYVANSTTLNGIAVPDPSSGVNPLHAGILVNAPEDTTAGYLRADATPGAANVATVTFDVVVDPNVMDGLIISNQGFVNGSVAGICPLPEQPSDDPNTPIADDPTRNIVGNLPLLYAHKTVQIHEDFGSPGIVDPGDVLLYTIVISNFGAVPATDVVLTDAVPSHTTYAADSLRLNGASLGTDGGVSPLIAGLPVHSADDPGLGIISAGGSAVVTFEAAVNAGEPVGTLISNQGSLTSGELPPDLTDADGVPSNGRQPTVVVVGDVQYLSVTKQVLVIGGGTAVAGGQLEYVIRVTNIGSLPATRVVVTDDLGALSNQVTYVAGSGSLDGASAGVSSAGDILVADYAALYGDLQPGAGAIVRFRVQINPALAIGTTITNTGVVRWNDPAQTASASVSIDTGGTPSSCGLNGSVWHDANLDKLCDTTETILEGWSVELYCDNQLVATVLTGADGSYRLSGIVPNEDTAQPYEIRFRAPGAGLNTASLGYADSPFTDGPQRIDAIAVASGANLQNLNLPIWPNGAVYNSVSREPVAGARLALLNAATGAALPSQCFDDPAQQNQVTASLGFYKFDLNFSDAACPAGGAYLIEVTPPATGYMATPSQVIPPASDATTAPFSVPACPGSADDAVPATGEYCEVTASVPIPPVSVPPRTAGTIYHLHLLLSNGQVPGHSQIFNNPIPIDPELNGAVAITKTSSMTNVSRAELVPYTITVTNVYGVPLYDISIVDRLPAGFKYMADSARLDGNPAEPRINGRELVWDDLELQVNQRYTIQFLLVVGSGVSEGEYVNRALVLNTATGGAASQEATATVRVIPDPDFDCTDVIGKVFDDRNLNGQQDTDEKGLSAVRVVTARGLIAATDEYGRFHVTCAAVPDEDRGSNFILKLDERSLPSGYRLTTENPRVQRATRGKMIRFNFGATIHRVVRIDIADGVFEPNTTELRLQWTPKIAQLLEELKKAPSVLRLSYLADVEREGLVRKRLDALKKEITSQWERSDGGGRLAVETEVFWRRGAPLAGQ